MCVTWTIKCLTRDTITYPSAHITALTATQEMEKTLIKFRKIKLYFLWRDNFFSQTVIPITSRGTSCRCFGMNILNDDLVRKAE